MLVLVALFSMLATLLLVTALVALGPDRGAVLTARLGRHERRPVRRARRVGRRVSSRERRGRRLFALAG